MCIRDRSKTTLDSITIQDITDDAEVSRKTFYYHFQDIYDLLDWTLQEDIHRLIVSEIELDNWEESIAALFAYMQANRLLILNAFHSLERDTLEREVFKLLSPLLHRLFSAQSGFDPVSYTHLDVYKRQAEYRAIPHFSCASPLSYHERGNSPMQNLLTTQKV